MVEFRRVDDIPVSQRGYKATPETLALAAEIATLEPGEVIQLVIPDNISEDEQKKIRHRTTQRAKTAIKHVKTGFFRLAQRQMQLFIQRTE